MQPPSFTSTSTSWFLATIASFLAFTQIGPPIVRAEPLSINVLAPDATLVGTIEIAVSLDGKGVVGDFTSTYGATPSLAAAAAKCGSHHFNWLQVVVVDDNPPMLPGGLYPEPPYFDPAPGGFADTWADDRPWYWDEGPVPAPLPPNWAAGYHLDDQTTVDRLNFIDYPSVPGDELPRVFQTFLVGVNADGSLHSIYGGFNWMYMGEPIGWGGIPDENRTRNLVPSLLPGTAMLDGDPLPRGTGFFWADFLIGLTPGDVNLDGRVDEEDAKMLAANWGKQDPSHDNVTWAHGDFNFDGRVDAVDAAILAANWTTNVPMAQTAPVPEPGIATMLLGALCLSAIIRRPTETRH